ncbi:MAG: D-alanyl-D-alanine carboxypeptidase family protein [Candidatus Uhrbacteria bacterium]
MKKKIKLTKILFSSTVLLFITLSIPLTAMADGDRCFCYNSISGCETVSGDEISDASSCTTACQTLVEQLEAQYERSVFVPDTYVYIEQYEMEVADCTNAAAAVSTSSSDSSGVPTPIPPIIPKLNIDIPGFSEDLFDVVEDGNYLNINFLGEYVVAWYRWLTGAAVIIATVMIMVGGVQYMLGKGMGQVTSAKNRISSAVIGLVLLLGSYVILYTVNPQLTFFEPLRVDYVAYVALPLEEQADLAYDPNLGKLCDSIESCREWCTLTNNGTDEEALKAEVPTLATAGMASPDDLEPISGISGLETNGGDHMLSPEAMDMLRSAATIAKNRGVTLYVVSSYRPLLQQLELACDEIVEADNATRSPKIPSAVAWPGGSAHGTGTAVDIKYYTGTPDNLSWNVSFSSQDTAPAENVALLAEIMYGAGWSRYIKEIWHFQAYSGNCTSQSCKVAESSCTCN